MKPDHGEVTGDEKLRIQLGLPVGRRASDVDVRNELRDLKATIATVIEASGITPSGCVDPLHDLLEAYTDARISADETASALSRAYDALWEAAHATGIGVIGDDMLSEVLPAIVREAKLSRRLRGLVERWQGYAGEMLTQRDDFARLYGRETHTSTNLRAQVIRATERAERFASYGEQQQEAAKHWQELAEGEARAYGDLYRATATSRTLFKRRIGNVETGWLDVGFEVKIENGQLVACWWRRIGTDFKGWLRAW